MSRWDDGPVPEGSRTGADGTSCVVFFDVLTPAVQLGVRRELRKRRREAFRARLEGRRAGRGGP